MKDPELFPRMQLWPTQKFIRFSDGEAEIEIFDDISTGRDYWGFQDAIGTAGIATPLIFFSDATLISRFNGRKFHPVIMRNGLVPVGIRNREGEFGSGTVVGMIPSVSLPIY